MNRAIIFCNGDLTDLSRIGKYIDKKTLLIGCDGGTSHILSLGLMPHVVIGDFDSISSKTLRALKDKKVELIKYPKEKDITDSELGLTYTIGKSCREIIITGIRGTSTDHFLGNLFMLAKKQYASLNIKIVEGKEEVVLVRKHIRIKGKKSDIVSLVPIGQNVSGVTTKGLFYPLKNDTLKSSSARGIRNRMTGKHAEISIQKGTLLVIHRL
ncbi:thiamine diphosphokinase [Candidatus Kaiserbacteria bacterium RIFCSPLOWO2_12_FULL_53_8]|uniref:Thiamine diphosphokinase n=2 Tax=Candidatus Kaiseribacteriota TaxID=1752734 RepID=A0A1F6CUZ5_9BACT|nr:MAG: thiamine diphosphokinase [Candidatus Kaiserbacteria bacterium RIFCSPHIGHO2_01_FULL_53_29]OGG91579.1 MAG: thiamine diphosphokinase [Candidatus Kaiserbacteria bacterium RIFCSPLOWO2_12_FULL_53_8]